MWSNFSTMWSSTDDQSVNSKTVTISVVLVPISLYYCTRHYIKLGLNRVLSAARTEEESCHCSCQPLVAPRLETD